MSANITVVDQKVNQLRQELALRQRQFEAVLPSQVKSNRFFRVLLTNCTNNPKLLDCDRPSLMLAAMTCAQLGLEPDNVLGQAYLVPYGKKVQLIPGYKGLIQLARNSGEIKSIQAHEVCEGDEFEYHFGVGSTLRHKPALGQRGEIKFFYAVAEFKDGGHYFDVLTKTQVDMIRDESAGYKYQLSQGKKDNPWFSHYAEMGKKTAIRAIAKYLPLSVQKAVALDEAYDQGKMASFNEAGDIILDTPTEEEPENNVPKTSSRLDELAEREAQKPGQQTLDVSPEAEAVA